MSVTRCKVCSGQIDVSVWVAIEKTGSFNFLNGYFLPVTTLSLYDSLNFQRLYSIHSRDLPDSSSWIDDNITERCSKDGTDGEGEQEQSFFFGLVILTLS